jgi:putative nucleotidyltransferase with HDIG domain
MIPSRDHTFEIIREKSMPPHILYHSVMVRRVAVCIAYVLVNEGKNIDICLVDRASLLHDICKIDSIRSGGDHAHMGQQLMEDLGYPEVGEIVGQHVMLNSLFLNEAMVVNYADKKVMHEKIVSIPERFIDLMTRYGKDDMRRERILSLYHFTLEEEIIIKDAANIDPLWLNNLNLIPVQMDASLF